MLDPIPAPPTGFSRRIVTPLADALGLTTLPLHIHEILFAFLAYNFLCSMVVPAVSEYFFPAIYRKLFAKTKIDWDIRVVSLFQSSLMTAATLTVMVLDKEHRDAMGWQERLWGYDGASGMLQGFAAGYFLWDVQVSTIHLSIMGYGSLFHGISALTITCLGFRPFANYYGIHFLLYETSTPFLNIHWFLDKVNMTGSTLQLVNGIVLIATFGCNRVIWGTYQSVLIYNDLWTAWNHVQSKATMGEQLENITNAHGSSMPEVAQLASWLAIIYLGSNTILCFLNYYWFGLMISSVRKRFAAKKEKDHSKTESRKSK